VRSCKIVANQETVKHLIVVTWPLATKPRSPFYCKVRKVVLFDSKSDSVCVHSVLSYVVPSNTASVIHESVAHSSDQLLLIEASVSFEPSPHLIFSTFAG